MTKQEVLAKIKELKLPEKQFIIYGATPLAVYGIREARDIDMFVTPELYKHLEEQDWKKVTKGPKDTPVTFDIFEAHNTWDFSPYAPSFEELKSRATEVEGILFASLEDVRKWKEASGRPKDITDLQLIDDYVKTQNVPHVSIDILIIRDNKILLGLMTKQWSYEGRQVYGVPGRDIHFQEHMGNTLKRNIREEFGCNVTKYEVISVNANYALDNHYIGIGILAEIDGEPKNSFPQDWEKWEWFEKDALPENLFPATKNLINSYMQKKITVSE